MSDQFVFQISGLLGSFIGLLIGGFIFFKVIDRTMKNIHRKLQEEIKGKDES
jgi:ammonia channel protein AmtB